MLTAMKVFQINENLLFNDLELPSAFTRETGNLWEQHILTYYLRTWEYLASVMKNLGHKKAVKACQEYKALYEKK